MRAPTPSRPSRPGFLARFVATEASGGVALLAATAVALAWANSPWHHGYETVFGHDVQHWVNEGPMALFFFVVGLEIKRELVHGELREWRRAALPALAAVGGMVVPALVYVAATAGRGGSEGWAIPMATDIAFALGVVSLVGPRVPAALKAFLLTLAVVDDVGAIVVIAAFYSGGVSWLPLLASVLCVAAVGALARRGVRGWPLYLALGVGAWVAAYHAGVHATLAGVALGLVCPPRSTEVLEERLHPWTTFAVVPVFALANAGVALGGDALAGAVRSPVAAGVVLGLVVGKPAGILAFSWLAVRLGVGARPAGVSWPHLAGVGLVAGIGFTVSLFVTGLAFGEGFELDLAAHAKVAILAASLVASVAGAAVLRLGPAPPPD